MAHEVSNQFIQERATDDEVKAQDHPRQIVSLESCSKPERYNCVLVELRPDIQH